jgi:hypothetical protein
MSTSGFHGQAERAERLRAAGSPIAGIARSAQIDHSGVAPGID